MAASGFRILRELGVRRATTSVAPADMAGKRPVLTDSPRQRRTEVAAPSNAAPPGGPAQAAVPLLHATGGVPYDARAVLGAGASPPLVAGVGPAAPDFVIFPVPSRFDDVVGVPLETLPPLPAPRLHREP